MKRYSWAIIIAVLMFVAGCDNIYEMKHQSYITAMGIDLIEDNKIHVSLLKLSIGPSTHQESNGNDQQNQPINIKVIDASCTIFPNCFDQLRSELSGRLTLDKVRYILLGKGLLESGVKPYFDYFSHIGQLEQTVKLFSTDQKITDFLHNDNGEIMNRLIGSIQSHPHIFDVEMWQFSPKIYSELHSPIISMLSIKEKEIQSNNIHLLKGDSFGINLSSEEAKLLHLLVGNKVRELTFMLLDDNIAFNVRKYSVNMKISPKIVDVHVYTKGWGFIEDTKDNQAPHFNNFNLEKNIAKEIKNELQSIINHTQSKGIDFLGIGEKFRQKNWDTSNWDAQLKELDIRVHTKVKLMSGYGS